jgi:ABC-2 type transport system permease protein
MHRLFLFLVKIMAPVWKLSGADVRQLLLILDVKLMMSNREPVSIKSGSSKKKYNLPPAIRAFIRILLPAGIGITYIPILLLIPDKEVGLLFTTFSYFLFAGMLLIMTFSSQLTDTSDNIILLPRPVNNRTLVLYRLLFTGYRFLITAVPISFATVITLMIRDGWLRGLYYLLLTLPGLVLTFAMVQLLLILLLRIVPVSIFKKTVFWLQAVMVAWVFLSMQGSFLNRITQTDLSFALEYTTLLSFMPQYWIVTAWMHTAPVWIHIVLWLSPVICLFIIVRYLAPRFSSRLSEMGNGSEAPVKITQQKKKAPYRKQQFFLLRHPAARAGYLFTRKFISRTPEYKMTVLPSYVYVVITAFPLLGDIWNMLTTGNVTIKDHKWFFPLYILLYPITTALAALRVSSQYKASWIYELAPFRIKGYVRLGAGWALFTRYYIPAFLLWAALALTLTRMAIWSNMVLTLANAILIFLLQTLLLSKDLPASVSPEDQKANKQSGFFKVIFIMLLSIGIGALHILLAMNLFWWIHLLLSGMSIAAAWLVWDKISRTA